MNKHKTELSALFVKLQKQKNKQSMNNAKKQKILSICQRLFTSLRQTPFNKTFQHINCNNK